MKLFNYQYRKCVGEQPLLLFELPKTKKLCVKIVRKAIFLVNSKIVFVISRLKKIGERVSKSLPPTACKFCL